LLGEEEVRRYLLYLNDERKVSWSSVNVGYAALKFFYVHTLYRDWQVNKIPRPKGRQYLPVVLSHSELAQLFSATSNLKHWVIFRTIYSAGLRVSEAANLKPFHIESGSKRIRVEQGKCMSSKQFGQINLKIKRDILGIQLMIS
jgi:site-specific recombinase XerD